MAHSKADVIQSRLDLAAAIAKEIAIHRGYIAALENALRGLRMVSAVEEPAKLTLTNEDGVPTVKGFVERLTDRIASAGNGDAA